MTGEGGGRDGSTTPSGAGGFFARDALAEVVGRGVEARAESRARRCCRRWVLESFDTETFSVAGGGFGSAEEGELLLKLHCTTDDTCVVDGFSAPCCLADRLPLWRKSLLLMVTALRLSLCDARFCAVTSSTPLSVDPSPSICFPRWVSSLGTRSGAGLLCVAPQTLHLIFTTCPCGPFTLFLTLTVNPSNQTESHLLQVARFTPVSILTTAF